jgi:hypothetical protein
VLARAQRERVGHRQAVELGQAFAVLVLDAGHQAEHDVLDGHVVVAATAERFL